MAAFKQFLSSDLIVTPFEVNKGFTFLQSEFADSDVSIDLFLGTNNSFFSDQSTTGTISTEYQSLIYSSVKELYYSNFLSSSRGSSILTASLIPGETPEGDVLVGPTGSDGRYYNYLQSTLVQSRYFPTGSGDEIAVFSIPSLLYGDFIQPSSFEWVDGTNSLTLSDDGNGNILSGSTSIGNIIYQHGLVIITQQSFAGGLSGSSLVESTNITCSFSSSYTLYETQYKATLRESEFNFSQNPSIISGSNGEVYDYVTGSYFAPYVTTVGLYDEAQNLLAVGKLSQPLPTSRTTDTNIYINLDR